LKENNNRKQKEIHCLQEELAQTKEAGYLKDNKVISALQDELRNTELK